MPVLTFLGDSAPIVTPMELIASNWVTANDVTIYTINAATSFDNAIDQNTLNFTNSPSSYKGFSAVRYKENVLQDELAYIYASHAATVWFIGINYR